MAERAEEAMRTVTRPAPLVGGLVRDAVRSRDELIAENTLLRQQLLVAARTVKKSRFTRCERGLFLILARLVPRWREALLLVKPDTILRWHREGFRLFWRVRSRPEASAPRISPETVELIGRLAHENRLWGVGDGPRFILRDNDDKFGPDFDRVATGAGVRVLRTAPKAPLMNSFCERFLGSVRRECLDHIVVLGARHLERVLREYCFSYFNRARPHQGIGQRVPFGSATSASGGREIVAVPVLSGLHHDYQRAA
jgi:transposase InsO family protein